ncbi:MAG: glycosyltransferase family 4 protein [Thermoplasmata archaeon]|nr:glycosyltransferase family 4 protein [Thermoplasmata archaeon]
MRIAMIARTIPPFDRGGIQRHVRDLSTALGMAGHEVHLVIEGKQVHIHENVTVHTVRPIPLPRLTAGQYVSLSLLAARRARRLDVDVTHVHSMYGFGQALMGRGPTVATLHGTQVCELRAAASSGGTLNHLATDSVSVVMEGYVARKARRLIAVSEENRRDIVSQYEVPPGKISVIPNGVWPDDHSVSDMSMPEVVAVGRLHERKGFDLLIRAFARAAPEVGDHRLTIVGSGEMESRLRALARKEGVGGRVRFAGHLPDRELRSLLSHARLLAMPSRYEGFGMVMVEGMASGLPVLATRVGAAPEVIEHGVNGFLAGPEAPGDPSMEARTIETLAASLAEALSDVGRLGRMGAQARRTAVGRFSWTSVAASTAEVYRAAIDGTGGAG